MDVARLDTQNAAHVRRLHDVFRRHVPDYESTLGLEELTGGASRQILKARVRAGGAEHTLVLRKSVKVGKSEIEQLTLAQEVAVCRIAHQAGVRTPGVLFAVEEEDGIGEGYAMPFVHGESLGGRIAKSPKFARAREKLTEQVGCALARIHAIDIEANDLQAVAPVLTPLHAVESIYAAYRATGLAVPMLDYCARWLLENIPPEVAPVLTHGDYRNGNFLVDPDDGLVAIIDWELARIADPMRDLAWVAMMPWRYGAADLEVGGFGTLRDLYATYESSSGREISVERIRWWQAYGYFWWSIACIVMGVSYRATEGQLSDRISIGRRYTEGLIDLANMLMPGPTRVSQPPARVEGEVVSSLRELVESSLANITTEISPALKGKTLFVSRVVAESLRIALREINFGEFRDREELVSARILLNEECFGVGQARRRLCEELRREQWRLEPEALKTHLRATVARQISIDQPSYPGLKHALEL